MRTLLAAFAALMLIPTTPRADAVHATIRTWADGTWLRVLVREGAAAGRLSRLGVLQRFSRTTDDEYWLDLISMSPPLVDDHAWHQLDRGLRFAATSVNPRDLAQTMDFKVQVPLGRSWLADARYSEAHGPDLDRNVLQLAFERGLGRRAFGRVDATLGSVKPSADIEIGGGWRSTDGRSSVFLGFTMLDAFNDIVYTDVEVHPNHADTALVYEKQPIAVRLATELGLGERLRLEAFGAIAPRARIRAFRQRTPDAGFRQDEEIAFGGLLAEWSFSPDVAAGVITRVLDARIDREPLPASSADENLTLDEEESHAGVFGIVRARENLRFEAWTLREWRTERRVPHPESALPAIDYADRSWIGTVKAIRGREEEGFQMIAAVDFDLRENVRGEREVPTTFTSLGDPNVRLRLDFGWRIRERGELFLGAGYDLDGDEHSDPHLFDGGRARFAILF